jgi:hypothetical protein
VADYHVKKLLAAGLIEEENSTSRYYVERVVFENMIRIRRSLIPLQVSYAAFFATALVILLTLLRPSELNGAYLFSLVIIAISLGIFVVQSIRSLKTQGIWIRLSQQAFQELAAWKLRFARNQWGRGEE